MLDRDERKAHSCCFTGHREIPPAEIEHIGALLSQTVEDLIATGFTDFYCGGALGFDTMAAVTVLNKKKKYPHIRLILAIPCADQTARWRRADRVMYDKIKALADEAVVLSSVYTPACMAIRNRYMVDHAIVCVAFVRHSGGGSASTVAYAQKRGCKVINLGLL